MKKALLLVITILFYNIAPAQTQSGGTASAQEVCTAVISFMNELLQGDYNSYIGDVYSESTEFLKIKKYSSKIAFPVAMRTLIQEKNELQKYRRAEILMFQEPTTDKAAPSQQMLDYYKQVCTLLKACLESNKFEYADPAPNLGNLYKNIATLSHAVPNPSGGAFANMQSGNTIVAQIDIEQEKDKDGKLTNDLYIIFKRQ